MKILLPFLVILSSCSALSMKAAVDLVEGEIQVIETVVKDVEGT